MCILCTHTNVHFHIHCIYMYMHIHVPWQGRRCVGSLRYCPEPSREAGWSSSLQLHQRNYPSVRVGFVFVCFPERRCSVPLATTCNEDNHQPSQAQLLYRPLYTLLKSALLWEEAHTGLHISQSAGAIGSCVQGRYKWDAALTLLVYIYMYVFLHVPVCTNVYQ